MFLLDSGAQSSITNNIENYSTLDKNDKRIYLVAGGGTTLSHGTGTIVMMVLNDRKKLIKLTLTNVAYFPDGKENLLCTRCLELSNNYYIRTLHKHLEGPQGIIPLLEHDNGLWLESVKSNLLSIQPIDTSDWRFSDAEFAKVNEALGPIDLEIFGTRSNGHINNILSKNIFDKPWQHAIRQHQY